MALVAKQQVHINLKDCVNSEGHMRISDAIQEYLGNKNMLKLRIKLNVLTNILNRNLKNKEIIQFIKTYSTTEEDISQILLPRLEVILEEMQCEGVWNQKITIAKRQKAMAPIQSPPGKQYRQLGKMSSLSQLPQLDQHPKSYNMQQKSSESNDMIIQQKFQSPNSFSDYNLRNSPYMALQEPIMRDINSPELLQDHIDQYLPKKPSYEDEIQAQLDQKFRSENILNLQNQIKAKYKLLIKLQKRQTHFIKHTLLEVNYQYYCTHLLPIKQRILSVKYAFLVNHKLPKLSKKLNIIKNIHRLQIINTQLHTNLVMAGYTKDITYLIQFYKFSKNGFYNQDQITQYLYQIKMVNDEITNQSLQYLQESVHSLMLDKEIFKIISIKYPQQNRIQMIRNGIYDYIKCIYNGKIESKIFNYLNKKVNTKLKNAFQDQKLESLKNFFLIDNKGKLKPQQLTLLLVFATELNGFVINADSNYKLKLIKVQRTQ